MGRPQRQYPKTSISFSGHEGLLARAEARAASKRWSLANYIRYLVETDLQQAGMLPSMHELNDEPSVLGKGTVPDSGHQVSYKVKRARKKTSSQVAHAMAALASGKKPSEV